MKWTDMFWTAYEYAVDTVIDTAVYTLNGVGSMACLVGGALLPVSYALDETLTASYSGSANTMGKVNVGIDAIELNYTISGSIPFQKTLARNDGITYKLQDYIQPSTVQLGSLVFVGAGTVLNVLSANLKLWQQGRIDRRALREHHGVECSTPSAKEHLYRSGGSFCDSLSYAMLSCTVTGLIIQYTGLIGSSIQFTYPPTSNNKINTTHYSGPVESSLIPVEYQLNQNATVDLPVVGINISVAEKVEALATINATYGGGLFFKSHNKTNFPWFASAIAGGITNKAGLFFSKKEIEARDNRINEARQYDYSLVN